MIDVIEAVKEAEPTLGSYVLVLRGDARALAGPDSFTPEAKAWLNAHAPEARLVRVSVSLSPYPGAEPQPRTLSVAAFADGRQLAAFASTWTGDPIEE
ncbi:hypothetical protein [Methylobacterium aerolatum]|uniref:Uncharacterized protein n=1 Tax=Methylobacterium aerolatum TaxID=418708 RepID=A0ABU0HWB7_9HYPH|nr:hypothetical protein [Methylobacterium aerolatum]MDQ0446629.1 hypothetical protein [Methylobacterium aerolatum]GJD33211.1 hypothetical protein FMGBMHLM_0097 [Methylobacterium aerolatum]